MNTSLQLIADRANLWNLVQHHPQWTTRAFAAELERAISWVKKWRRRFRQDSAEQQGLALFLDCPRHPPTPPPTYDPVVISAILDLRDTGEQTYRRVPGPKLIAALLPTHPSIAGTSLRLPRSERTIWKILCRNDRILRPRRLPHDEYPRAAPGAHWQIDFKDVSTVPADPEGKKQHGVETLNMVDVGSSQVIAAHVSVQFRMDTVCAALMETFEQRGLPTTLTHDRAVRFVGSHAGRDFPSPFMRYLLTLGITEDICPPQRPDRNGFVERYHRSYGQECIWRGDLPQRVMPSTVAEAVAVTADYVHFYNYERPHQGRTCGNRPPCVAHPTLAPRPSVPLVVDPDAWLQHYHHRAFIRHVTAAGKIRIDNHTYYIKKECRGKEVIARIDATTGEVVIVLHQREVQRLPLVGLVRKTLTYAEYKEHILSQARRVASGLALL